jgi:hypothetical protein
VPELGVGLWLGGHVAYELQATHAGQRSSVHHQELFLEARCACAQLSVGVDGKAAAFEHDLVLPSHQVGVEQRQACGQRTFAHGLFALAALAGMERRGIDDHQQFRPGGHGIGGGLLEPRVLANEQAYAVGLARAVGHLEHAGLGARDKVAALVEHLVVRQFALGVALHHLALEQHAGGVHAGGLRHAAGTPAPLAGGHGVTHHHMQAF